VTYNTFKLIVLDYIGEKISVKAFYKNLNHIKNRAFTLKKPEFCTKKAPFRVQEQDFINSQKA
jgi:hypothetical protein